MIEQYIKGKTYPVGTMLQWKNGTIVQVQENGSHKIMPKSTPNTQTQSSNVKKIITHVKGTKHPAGTLVKLSNGMIAAVQDNGGFKFLYKEKYWGSKQP